MPTFIEYLARTAAFVLGVALVVRTLLSAIRTFVMPRSVRDRISAIYFVTWRKLFVWRANRVKTYDERDRIMAMFAPLTLILMPTFWLSLVGVGYTLIFWALGVSRCTMRLRTAVHR
jgi:hypothetical protein